MINEKIMDALLKTAKDENKNNIIKVLLHSVSLSYDYNDNKSIHILDMLVDSNSIITKEDINIKYVEDNIKQYVYNYEKYNIKSIKVHSVDNINCTVRIEYEYIEKINEDREDISCSKGNISINFIDTPEILIREI